MESHMLEQSKRMKFVRMFIPAGKGCLAEEFDTLAFNIITHHLTLNPKSIQKPLLQDAAPEDPPIVYSNII